MGADRRRETTGHGFLQLLTAFPVLTSWLTGSLAILAVVFGSLWFPISNETGNRVSPATIQTSVDIDFYRMSAKIYFERPGDVVDMVLGTYSSAGTSPSVAPPLFPVLLRLFDYGPENTWPMSLAFVVMGSTLLALWLAVLHRKGLRLPSLVLVALLPQFAWFTLSVSSDLLFAILTGIFFYLFMDVRERSRLATWIVILLMVAARTNSLSIVLFFVLHLLIADDRSLRTRIIEAAGLSIGALIMCAFYIPSLIGTVEGSMLRFDHFGISLGDYLGGLFPGLPAIVDKPLSWAALLGAKTLYIVGLRPSFGGIDAPILLLRSLPGLLLLPGLVFLLAKAPRRERAFVVLFVLPIYVGVTQDRYLFPIMPLLAYYGIQAYSTAFGTLIGIRERLLRR
jgi:hypothetical protein